MLTIIAICGWFVFKSSEKDNKADDVTDLGDDDSDAEALSEGLSLQFLTDRVPIRNYLVVCSLHFAKST